MRHDERAHEGLLLLVDCEHVHRVLALEEAGPVALVDGAWLKREEIERHANRRLIVGDQDRVDRVGA